MTEFYTLKFILQRLKKQGCWKKFNSSETSEGENYHWFYYEPNEYGNYDPYKVVLELREKNGKVYQPKLSNRNHNPAYYNFVSNAQTPHHESQLMTSASLTSSYT